MKCCGAFVKPFSTQNEESQEIFCVKNIFINCEVFWWKKWWLYRRKALPLETHCRCKKRKKWRKIFTECSSEQEIEWPTDGQTGQKDRQSG